MNTLKIVAVVGMMAFGFQAFAHGNFKKGPCKMFWSACKSKKGKGRRMECVRSAAEADTTNGPACIASMGTH